MNHRFFVPFILLVLTAVLAGYWLASSGDQERAMATPVDSVPTAKPAPQPPSSEFMAAPVATDPPAHPQSAVPAARPSLEPGSVRQLTAKPPPDPLAEDPARQEAEAIALNIRQYLLRFGGNPVGTNAEIVAELNGGNPANARYLPAELLRLNAEGELIDEWGTPYFFHAESRDKMEVRSAGPDKQLFTSDDYVAH